jgi:hypothetical protein
LDNYEYNEDNEPISTNRKYSNNEQHQQQQPLPPSQTTTIELNSKSTEFTSISPIMISLCFDDVEVFKCLYCHHKSLVNYFKPCEYYELIFYAIKFQAKDCLLFLLNNKITDMVKVHYENDRNYIMKDSSSALENHFHDIDMMFYILSNMRSAQIVKVLISCGFDLCLRELSTGNTALHCLFNSCNNYINFDPSISQQYQYQHFKNRHNNHRYILHEYENPQNLSRILYSLIKHGGCQSHVNTLNNDGKTPLQVLFEWNELVNLVSFDMKTSDGSEVDEIHNRQQWQDEFVKCVRLLINSGAFRYSTVNNSDNKSTTTLDQVAYISNNCIDNLFSSILKHSMVSKHRPLTKVSKSNNTFDGLSGWVPLSSNDDQNCHWYSESFLTASQKQQQQHQQNSEPAIKRHRQKTLDMTFISFILREIINLNKLGLNLVKAPPHHSTFNNNNNNSNVLNSRIGSAASLSSLSSVSSAAESTTGSTISSQLLLTSSLSSSHNHIRNVSDNLITKLIEILLRVNLTDFDAFFEVFKMVCTFEKRIEQWRLHQLKLKNQRLIVVKASLIQRLITKWILHPNFLCASKQTEKNIFLKRVIIHLISEKIIDPNDCRLQSPQMNNSKLNSNNLMYHCLSVLQVCRTGYQFELIYDLIRTLYLNGANPNLNTYVNLLSQHGQRPFAYIVDPLLESGPTATTSHCLFSKLCASFETKIKDNSSVLSPYFVATLKNILPNNHQTISLKKQTSSYSPFKKKYISNTNHNNNNHSVDTNTNTTTNSIISSSQNQKKTNLNRHKSSSTGVKLHDLQTNIISIPKINDNIDNELTITAALFIQSSPNNLTIRAGADESVNESGCDWNNIQHHKSHVLESSFVSNTNTIANNNQTLQKQKQKQQSTSNNKNTNNYNKSLVSSSSSNDSLNSLLSASNSPTSAAATTSTTATTSNLVSNSSILYQRHYQKIAKFLFDIIDDEVIESFIIEVENRNTSNFSPSPTRGSVTRSGSGCGPSAKSKFNLNRTSSVASLSSEASQTKKITIDPLEYCIEEWASEPRSLKSLARRKILNHLKLLIDKEQRNGDDVYRPTALSYIVNTLPISKKLKEYLLFID